MAGPFFFAWVDSTATTFGVEHQIEDEKIFSFTVEQTEGDFCGLTIEIQNPKEGLLATTRKKWCWFSWDSGTGGVVPLFFGRVTGFPTGLLGEVISIEFTAKPTDYDAQKLALAETLKVLPYYDAIFIDASNRDDPDTVLEGYSALWHIDRVMHAVTVSDIISGEDGLEAFTGDEVPYDSVSFTLQNPPFNSVAVEMTVNWTQNFADEVVIGSQAIQSYTGDGILSDWPKPGVSLGGGWTALNSYAIDVYGVQQTVSVSWAYNYQNNAKEHDNGDVMSLTLSESSPVLQGPFLTCVLTDKGNPGLNDPFSDPPINIPATEQKTMLYVAKYLVTTYLSLTYNADRAKSEKLNFTLVSDLQPILSEPDELAPGTPITLNGPVDVAIPDNSTAGATVPIGDATRRSYFPIDRGLDSIRYGLLRARAQLLKAARAGQVVWDVSFDRAIDLSCRKNASLADDRLPGSGASGKITSYQIRGDGDQAKFDGNVTIGSAIGFGNSIAAVTGTPTYVVAGYVDPGYQYFAGATVLASTDLGFTPPIDVPNDDGLVFPLTRAEAVISESFTGSLAAQEAAITASFAAEIEIAKLSSTPAITEDIAIDIQKQIALAGVNSTANALKNNPISYNIELIDLTGKSFETQYDITTTDLVVPKQIDLEAAST